MSIQSHYQQALKFAGAKHTAKNQKVPGTNLSYIAHISNVAMEIMLAAYITPDFDLDFAVQVALLHDTIEDTETTYDELLRTFGSDIAAGVLALTKNEMLPKDNRILDSLKRIKVQPKEVWAVKLADRITNLQPPPVEWSSSKREKYLDDAKSIYEELKEGNAYLADRMRTEMEEYMKYLG
jgi:guanosine-3',5'-bis(diphosphate) 3'-pyrophosphohydrolase